MPQKYVTVIDPGQAPEESSSYYRITYKTSCPLEICLAVCEKNNFLNLTKKHISKPEKRKRLIEALGYTGSENDLFGMMTRLGIKLIVSWNIRKSFCTQKTHILCEDENNCTPPVNLAHCQGKYYLITDLQSCHKCQTCGKYFIVHHTCNKARRQFYFTHINSTTKNNWESIGFTPLGQYDQTHVLHLVYDIETCPSPLHRLMPFMLVFTLNGDEMLKSWLLHLIDKYRERDPDLKQTEDKEHFYWIHHPCTDAYFISKKFRALRTEIQYLMVNKILSQLVTPQSLPKLEQAVKLLKLQSFKQLDLYSMPTLVYDLRSVISTDIHCYEINILGHNISGFDEILLATQILQQDETMIPSPFIKLSRNFLPRGGKILFNDFLLTLPNPHHSGYDPLPLDPEEKKQHLVSVRHDHINSLIRGEIDLRGLKHIYFKYAVRDTYQLTHTSLRNAAKAYDLPIAKGHCPFTAVNDYMTNGTYSQDPDGFPAENYWANEEEYQSNKKLWQVKNVPTYDIIQETLEYCIVDVKVTSLLADKLYYNYKHFVKTEVGINCNFNVFQRPTISSNSQAIFRQKHYTDSLPTSFTLPGIYAPSNEMYDFIRASIRGGRCYPSYLGIYDDPIYVYDITGMYASALTHPMPYGYPLEPLEASIHIKLFQELLDRPEDISYFNDTVKPMILSIDAHPPNINYLDTLPPLCSRQSGRLCWTNEALISEIVTSLDCIILHNRGWQVEINTNHLNCVWPEWKCCCSPYVQINIASKEKADKSGNMVMRSISKLLSNSLYGSFATRADNTKIVFESHYQTDATLKGDVSSGKRYIHKMDTMPLESLPNSTVNNIISIVPEFSTAFSANSDTEESNSMPFSNHSQHVSRTEEPCLDVLSSYNYQPFNIVDVEAQDVTFVTLKTSSSLVENERYPTQLASFVLAWTRAFTSEWASFIFRDQWGQDLETREFKCLYGDTDSLFLTHKGHLDMLHHGAHRLKENNPPLVFDPDKPALTWAVECETICSFCKDIAYSSESIFLAPKLYALSELICESCSKVSKGKLRAKGHNKDVIDYETMKDCYYYHTKPTYKQHIAKKKLNDSTFSVNRFISQRICLKRTLTAPYGKLPPFAIHEVKLIRELRPWHDKTLTKKPLANQNALFPYDVTTPNPRLETTSTRQIEVDLIFPQS
ncbi:DNA-dependent DNA polymerase [White sturgeon adenovirus 1]|uniref:DNA polymerase n=2 Tax=Sturgeon ichtadenovirus A TaxID=691958 RepID=A0A4P8PNB6_9ADEN|nr:DNA-dependent DNA polymerase [White sturgeon adenovirus 1]QCQ84150.1 DNA-dependent DNA polymerase [White sturgeon adenovirus 1]